MPEEGPSGPRGDAASAAPPSAPEFRPAGSPTPNEDRTYATFVHLSSFSAYVGFPIGWILGPLILWIIKKDESPFIDRHGRTAMNFNLTLTLVVVLLYVFGLLAFFAAFAAMGASSPEPDPSRFFPMFGLPIAGFFMLAAGALALLIVHITFTVMAATRANKGEPYQYPLAIPFFK